MKRHLLFVLSLLTFLNAAAQQYILSGRITSQNNESRPFTSVYIRNSTYGTTSNENGFYQFKLSPGTYSVIFRNTGYAELIEKITITDHDEVHNVLLANEVVKFISVSQKWKRNRDPGDTIMRRVINNRQLHLDEVNAYSCSVYIKGIQKLLSSPKSLSSKPVTQALALDSTGKGILYQSELLSSFSYARPRKVKEVTIASKSEGISTAFSYNKASDLQVNFYDNIFTINGLSSRSFISPVAANAFSFYRYKLIGTTIQNGHTIDKIQVIPRRKHGQYFQGDLYIVEGDWRIYSANLFLTNGMNGLNLVDTLNVTQQYIPITDSVWMPLSTQFAFTGKVLGFKFGGNYIGIYNNYKINPVFPDGYFSGEILRIDTAANVKKENYWELNRPVPLTLQEKKDYLVKDSIATFKLSTPYLDSIQHTKNSINYPGYLIFGYNASNRTETDSLYIFPLLQTFYYTTVEGFGINAKIRYTKKLDDLRTLSFTPTLRYGFTSKMLIANIRADYKNDPFHYSRFFIDMGNDISDLNNVGTRSLYFNTLSTLLYENNYVKYYQSQYGGFGYQRELANGIFWTGSLYYADRTQLYNTAFGHIFDNKDKSYTSNNPLAPPGAPADDRSLLFPKNQALTFNTSVTFTFDQQYITRPTGKFNVPSRYPAVTLNYRKGINKAFGSDVDYDFVSADISKDHIRIGLTGYSSFKITGGGFINNNTIYFMDYNHFLGNQGTTFDPTYTGSFHFLPFYTYSTNGAFLEAHYNHNFSGSILNKVGILRKLKLEEVVGANYLTVKNNPNYSEFYIGIQRLIFRVDYGISFMNDKKYLQGFRIFYGIR